MNIQATDSAVSVSASQAKWHTLVSIDRQSGAGPSPFYSLEKYVYSGRNQGVLVAQKGADLVVFVKGDSVSKVGPVRLLKSQAPVAALLEEDPIGISLNETPEEEGFYPTSPVRYARFRR